MGPPNVATPAGSSPTAREFRKFNEHSYERSLDPEASSSMTMLQVMMVQGAVKASNYSTVEAASRFNTTLAVMEELMQKTTGCTQEKESEGDLNAPCSFDDFHCMEDDQ